MDDLCVYATAGRIAGPGGEEQVDPKVMAVCELLARHAGALVTRETILESVWGQRVVSDDVVSRCIYQLRLHLARAGGARSCRALVKTLPKRGYQLVGAVRPLEPDAQTPAAPVRRWPLRSIDRSGAWPVVLLTASLLFLAAAAWWALRPEPVALPGVMPSAFAVPGEAAASDAGIEGAAAGAAETAPAAAPTVAVLPFTDLSAAADHGYFADGLVEEIIGRLAAFPGLRVIGRTSSFALRDSGYGSRKISDLLGAQYLLEGSVREDGEALRISAQLLDEQGLHVWGATFDRELSSVFAIQSEIAHVVAASIVPQIAAPAESQRELDLDAYREYLVGRQLLDERSGLGMEDATDHFTRAIAIDPGFAVAYAARAVSLFFRSRMVDDHDAQIGQAWQDVETALALQPSLAQACAAKALLLERLDPLNLEEREILLRQALALDPTLPDSWNWLATTLAQRGRHRESAEVLDTGLRNDPLAPALNANRALFDARRGRTDAAEQRLE